MCETHRILYTGKGVHKNNPDSQGVSNMGPLPRGEYTIGPAYNHPKLGPKTMNLEPSGGQDMEGRSLFRIHGDSRRRPGDASNGCIVLGRTLRDEIARSSDKKLDVIR